MKRLLILGALAISFSSFAEYQCTGIKDTAIASFKIHKISATEFEAHLDGRLDSVELLEDQKLYTYYYNNGCDNDITIRINKIVVESMEDDDVQVFNFRMDYYGPDDLLTDTEVICRKIETKR